jgi:signal transduction histidine kinase
MKLTKEKSTLTVEGDPGPEAGANQEVEVTGKLMWRDRTPILTGALFQPTAPAPPSPLPVAGEPPQIDSIADFVVKAQRSKGLYPQGYIEASNLAGIVTFCGKVLGKNVLFVQGGNDGGVAVAWSGGNLIPELEPGQLVEMSGHSDIGRFPMVFEPTSLKVTGWGTLPKPAEYSSDLADSGRAQGRWVEVKGVIRSERADGALSLMTGEGAVEVWVGRRQATNAKVRVDTLVRLRGVLSMSPARQARLLVPGPEFIEVDEESPAEPFAVPRFSIAELGGLTLKPERLRRMKLCGVVTCLLRKGMYVQDETGGAFVETPEGLAAKPGDLVEVVGFPNRQASLVVSGALIRKTGTRPLPTPLVLAAGQNRKTNYEAVLIRTEAVVLEQSKIWDGEVLTLQAGRLTIEAALIRQDKKADRLRVFQPGSRVAVTGVWHVQSGNNVFGGDGADSQSVAAGLRIWLQTAADVVLIERPPWWTWGRISLVLALFAGALLGALEWVRILRRRVAQRTRELQATMRQLEQKTHAAAVLAERDRLAGEIHDSVEQGLTAIMLQLDMADNHLENSPQARNILRTARNMADFSRAEVQHAVWDMLSPLLANADFSTALKHVANQVSSSFVVVSVEIVGTPHPLPSSDEHHLLRIAQEAITNASKHAQAKIIRVTADYSGPELKLTIADDGVGFVPREVKSDGQSGHFGLKGMRNRAKRIKAQLEVASEMGKGTVITIRKRMNHGQPAAASRKRELL